MGGLATVVVSPVGGRLQVVQGWTISTTTAGSMKMVQVVPFSWS